MSVTPRHALSRVTSRELSRISHAMSTTPHHTNNYVSRLCISNYRRRPPRPGRAAVPVQAAMR